MAAYLKLVLSESDINTANNTSVVTAKLYYYGNGASYNYNNPSGTIKIDGTSYSFNHDFTTSSSAQLLATKSKTVTHNADGSKTVSVSASFKTGVSLGTLSTSASLKLTKIARTSTLSLNKTSVPADGSTTVIATATKQSSGFTDTITVTLGSYSQTVTSGTAFTIPKTWVNGISGTSATATVKVTTKSGSTTIGSNTKSLTITVPTTSEFYPTINDVSISEAVASVTSAFGSLYVRNLSQLNVSVDASGAYSSTIKSYSTSVNGVTYSAQAFTSNALNVAGDITLTTTVTDSRGRTATTTETINVVDYAMPSITSMTYYPCDDDGNRDSNGTNTKVIIGYKVYPVNEQNTKSMKLSYKAMADENYTERTVTLTDWEGTVETIVSGTDSTVTYEYIAELTDKINVDNPEIFTVTTGLVTLSRLAGGKGVTLFEEATEEGFKVGGGQNLILGTDSIIVGDESITLDPANGSVNINGGIYIPNGQWIYMNNASGVPRAMVTSNSSNGYSFGNGSYANSEGIVYYEGNTVSIYSRTGVYYNGKTASMVKVAVGYTGTFSVAANSYTDKTVTFPSAFTTIPRISLTLVSSSTAGAIGSITPAVKGSSETTSSFVIRTFNAGSASRSPGVIWVATEVL